ncbi:transposon Ty3-I Gag-Pol polyprotein [Trichonephila clavipes]|nr:transposon Ty3-I Gag-Pol polyprotein [Trichonephila clavipes]
MNYYNTNVKNNKGLDQVPDSPEADLKRLFNPAMVVEDTVPKQTTIRPQCKGKNERVNQTLVAKLRCKVNSPTKIPWTKLLEQVTYEYNNSPHDVTGFPPTYLMFGTLPYDSPLPNQVKLNYPPIQQERQIAVNRTIKHHKINKQSDEAHFWLNGYVNKQNCRIFSEANPQVYVETPLHPEKLTIWCALWAGGILLQKR